MAPTDQDQLLTASQAASRLGVHLTTVRRWIRQGKLPAYRVGDKGVRVCSSDLAALVHPIGHNHQKGGAMWEPEQVTISPLTEEEKTRGRQVLAELRQLRDEDLKRRGNTPYPPSSDILNQLRDERTTDLIRGLEE